MRRIGQLAIILASLMLMTIKCSGGVNPGQARDTHQAIAAELTAATLAAPLHVWDAQRVCVIAAGGQPGIKTWKMPITVNSCGIAIRSAMECWQPGSATGFWVTGPAETRKPYPGHPVISEASCGLIAPPTHIEPYEAEFSFTGKAPWRWFGIGPHPVKHANGGINLTVADPPGNCAVKPSGTPGDVTFTLHIAADPCGLKIRAGALCNFPVPLRIWYVNGNVLRAPGLSRSSCIVAAPMTVYGFQWSKPGARSPRFYSITVRPPHSAKYPD